MRNPLKFFGFLVLMLSATVFAKSILGSDQNRQIDSLQIVLKNEVIDTLRIQAALNLAVNYAHIHPQKALEYAEISLEWAQKIKNKRLIAKANNEAGIAYFNLGLLEQAALHISKFMEYAQEHNLSKEMSEALINISAVRLQLKQFEKAEKILLEALKVSLQRVAETNDSIPKFALATIYNNLGVVSKEKGDIKGAENYYLQGIYTIQDIHSQHYNLANLYNNLGMIYIISGDYEQALVALEKALDIRVDNNDKQGVAASYRNLGVYSEKVNNEKLAKQYYYKAISIARETENKTLLEGIYENVYNLYQKTNNADSALKYYILLKEQQELINSDETNKVLLGMELTMQFQEKEKLRLAEQKRKDQWYYFVGLLLLLLATIIGLLYVLSQARLRRLRLETTNSELANKNLQLMKDQLELDLETKNKELVTNVMYQIKRNEMMDEMVQKLLKNSSHFRKENQALIKSIIQDLEQMMGGNMWNEFEMRFQHVHNDFYIKLNAINPELTPNERRLCAFLRLTMSTKEIASITGQSQRSIEVARTRLRKKLYLTNSEQGLIEFLSQV
jgi:tetratricopeptide (TPR) repeat protein/DNA-binding CsgD family transcriptional regulator